MKVNQSLDISSILAKRSGLPASITIKTDMSIQEQFTEGLLLKERWSLIKSGVNKKDIKIELPVLYLEGKKDAAWGI